MTETRLMLSFVVLFWGLAQPGYALDRDAEQAASLQADDFEIDFNTGMRVYRGNVVFQQGSLRLNCQQLTTYLNDDEQVDKAVCTGSPGRFSQRLEGQDTDIVGRAEEITINQIKQMITLKGGLKTNASVLRGSLSMSGKMITYNLSTQKAKVSGGDASATNANNARPRLVIQPKKKPALKTE